MIKILNFLKELSIESNLKSDYDAEHCFNVHCISPKRTWRNVLPQLMLQMLHVRRWSQGIIWRLSWETSIFIS